MSVSGDNSDFSELELSSDDNDFKNIEQDDSFSIEDDISSSMIELVQPNKVIALELKDTINSSDISTPENSDDDDTSDDDDVNGYGYYNLEPEDLSEATPLPKSNHQIKAICVNYGIIEENLNKTNLNVHRLLSDLIAIEKSKDCDGDHPLYKISLVKGNIFHWEIFLYRFKDDSLIEQDLLTYCGDNPYVKLDVVFPIGYPCKPPFIRVLSPPITGGHVAIGGAIILEPLLPTNCMYFAQKETYSCTLSIEVLINQIRTSLVDGNARVNLQAEAINDYTEEKARLIYDFVLGLIGLDLDEILRNVLFK